MKLQKVLLLLSFCSYTPLFASTIGSDTMVTLFNTQQTVNNGVRIASFAALAAGFSLLDNSVIGSFDSSFAVQGEVALSGGTLILESDLILQNISQIISFGNIVGNNHVLSLSKNISLVPTTSSSQCFEWGNLTVCLNCNVTLQDCCITFTGNCTINGKGNCLTLQPTCTIQIGANSSLMMKNIIVRGLQASNIMPLDSTSTLSLKSAKLILSDDFVFDTGSFQVFKNVSISGIDHTFSYQTDQKSVINANSTLKLNDALTFDYFPQISNTNLLELADNTATLFLKGATLKLTTTNLQFTQGIVSVDRNSKIESI